MNSKKDRTIIIFSEISWNFLRQRHHFFTEHFMKEYRKVIFVERVVSRIPNFSEIIRIIFNRKKENMSNKRLENVVYVRSLFLPNENIFFRIWNKFYWMIFWRNKQTCADIYAFTDNPYVVGNTIKIKQIANRFIFDVIHNWWNFPWKKEVHKKNVERQIYLCDAVVTDSHETYQLIKKKRKKIIPPGVSEDWISNQDIKAKTQNKNIKLIFFGSLRANSDIEFIKKIIKEKKLDFSIFGRIDQSISDKEIVSCYKGSVDNKDLPKLITNYDGIVISYDKNLFSTSISPAKFYESLATGKPIFSRNNLEHLDGWSKFVYQVSLEDNMFENITQKVKNHENLVSDQISFAKNNLWSNRFLELKKILDDRS